MVRRLDLEEVHSLNLNYILVGPRQMDNAWPILAPWILQAMGDGTTQECVDGVRADIMRGTSQLWAIQKDDGRVMAVVVTEAMKVAGRMVLVLRWLGGTQLDIWLDDLGIIERWAMIQGFERVEVWGRPGWSKILAPHGYKESFRVLTKSVDIGVH